MVGARLSSARVINVALETKKRKRRMSKYTSEKRGLVLGVIGALLASTFGVAPASATPATNAFFFAPIVGTSYSTLVDEDFSITVNRNPAVLAASEMSNFKYSITTNRTWNTTFSMEVAAGAGAITAPVKASTSDVSEYANQRIYYNGFLVDGGDTTRTTISGTVASAPATDAYVIVPATRSQTAVNMLSMVFHGGVISSSATLTVTVTAFVDANSNNRFDSATEVSATQVVTFATYGSLTRAVTLTPLFQGDTRVTADITASGVNLQQLDGTWYSQIRQYSAAGLDTNYSVSPTTGSIGFVPEAADATLAFSRSYTISTSNVAHTVSAQLGYAKAGLTYTASGAGELYFYAAAGSVTVGADAADAFSVAAVDGDNVDYYGTSGKYHVRPNATYTIRVTASSIASTSPLPSVTFTFSNAALSATRTMIVNGGTADITGTHSAVSVVFNSSGVATMTVAVTGFAATGYADAISISASVNGLAVQEIALYPMALDWTVTADSATLATAAGTAARVGVSVKDQFGVLSALTNQRVTFTWGTGYNGTATTSNVVLTGGLASTDMLFSPATSTGSFTVTAQLQSFDSGANLWSNSSGDSTTITVVVHPSGTANAFRAGLRASYSASISYGAGFSWSAVINHAYVALTGSAVVVSGTGLIFKDDSALARTASDRITLPGDSNAQVKFYVTARKAGSYVLTLTAGTATTTSLIVVSPARSDAGASITWDTTAIDSGKTKVVTGTLLDLNGNPVDTAYFGSEAGDSGTASIAISFAGTAGVPVGTMPTETNADGKFRVSVLTSAADSGTMTLTAVYSPQGAATATADKVTSVQAITVAPAAPVEASAVIGSFNGRWAVRVENGKGSVVSVKAGSRWVKFTALNNNYLFSRKSVVGRTIAVSVWVDGELQNSQTITIK